MAQLDFDLDVSSFRLCHLDCLDKSTRKMVSLFFTHWEPKKALEVEHLALHTMIALLPEQQNFDLKTHLALPKFSTRFELTYLHLKFLTNEFDSCQCTNNQQHDL